MCFWFFHKWRTVLGSWITIDGEQHEIQNCQRCWKQRII